MLLSIPEKQGKSREYDFGALAGPWLMIADIIISGAYQGWSYWRTKQQIEQAKNISGTSGVSASDIDAVTRQVLTKLGMQGQSTEEAQAYITRLLTGSPSETQQAAPSSLLELQRVNALTQPQPQQGVPTWGWVMFGVLGFMLLRQMGMLGGG